MEGCTVLVVRSRTVIGREEDLLVDERLKGVGPGSDKTSQHEERTNISLTQVRDAPELAGVPTLNVSCPLLVGKDEDHSPSSGKRPRWTSSPDLFLSFPGDERSVSRRSQDCRKYNQSVVP